MKKIVLFIMGLIFLLIIGLIVFLLIAVRNNNAVNNLEGVTLEIQEETISDIGFTVTIRNESEYRCSFGGDFSVEQKILGGWYPLAPINDNVGFNDIGYPIRKNGSKEFVIGWDIYYGKLKAGEYRVIKDFFIEDDDGNYIRNDDGSAKEYYVAAEFTVK